MPPSLSYLPQYPGFGVTFFILLYLFMDVTSQSVCVHISLLSLLQEPVLILLSLCSSAKLSDPHTFLDFRFHDLQYVFFFVTFPFSLRAIHFACSLDNQLIFVSSFHSSPNICQTLQNCLLHLLSYHKNYCPASPHTPLFLSSLPQQPVLICFFS